MVFTYAQLDVILAQKHGMTTHHLHGCFCGDAGPGAALVEHHGHCLAREGTVQRFRRLLAGGESSLDGGLVRRRIENEFCELGWAEVANRQEMPGLGGARQRSSLDMSHGGFNGAASSG